MGFTHRIDSASGYVYLHLEGIVTGEELLEGAQRLTEDDAMRSGVRILADLSGIEHYEVSAEDVQRLATWQAATKGRFRDMLIAVVAESDMIFGMVRMWELVTDEEPYQARVFRSVTAAEAWLEDPQR